MEIPFITTTNETPHFVVNNPGQQWYQVEDSYWARFNQSGRYSSLPLNVQLTSQGQNGESKKICRIGTRLKKGDHDISTSDSALSNLADLLRYLESTPVDKHFPYFLIDFHLTDQTHLFPSFFPSRGRHIDHVGGNFTDGEVRLNGYLVQYYAISIIPARIRQPNEPVVIAVKDESEKRLSDLLMRVRSERHRNVNIGGLPLLLVEGSYGDYEILSPPWFTETGLTIPKKEVQENPFNGQQPTGSYSIHGRVENRTRQRSYYGTGRTIYGEHPMDWADEWRLFIQHSLEGIKFLGMPFAILKKEFKRDVNKWTEPTFYQKPVTWHEIIGRHKSGMLLGVQSTGFESVFSGYKEDSYPIYDFRISIAPGQFASK